MAILEAGEFCVAQKLDALKISASPAQCGVAVGTAYNYFTNKNEIPQSLLDRRGVVSNL